MRLPVDTSAMTLVAMAAPEPVVDFTTRQPKADPNGQPLYTVQVAAVYGDQGEVLAVKVAGEPAGIRPGGAVEVAGLVAQPWELGDRFGSATGPPRSAPPRSPREVSGSPGCRVPRRPRSHQSTLRRACR